MNTRRLFKARTGHFFLFFIVFALISGNLSAQIVTIGTATTSTTNRYYTPIVNNYTNGRMQFIITAAELLAAGAPAGGGAITAIGFQGASNTANLSYSFTVGVKHTSLGTLTGNLYTAATWSETGFTNIFSGSINSNAVSGWRDRSSSGATFCWDGTSNIMVQTCVSGGVSGTTAPAMYYSSAFADCGRAASTPGTGSGCSFYSNNSSAGGASSMSWRPNIRFTFSAATISLTTGIEDQTICGAMTTTTYTYGGAGTGATVTNLPAGLTSSVNTTTKVITISGTPTASGTYTITVNVGACASSATVEGTITLASPSPSAVNTLISPSSLANGDYLWSGNASTAWGTAGNWYKYNGSSFETASSVPSTSTKVYILPTSATSCISSTNSATVNTASHASNVFIGSGATVNGSSNTLNVYGNWTNNGTFAAATGTVNFTGSSNTIGGSGTNAFYNMTTSKSAGGVVTLNGPVSVTGTLTMTSGNISTTSTNLLTVGSSASVTGSVAWTAGTVLGPMKRFFASATNSTQASGIFPVGNAAVNRYAVVNFSAAPAGGGYIIAQYRAGICPVGLNGITTTVNGQLITNYEDEGYWEITPYSIANVAYGALNASAYSLTLFGNALTTINVLSKARIIKTVSHTTWDNTGIGSHTSPVGTTSSFTIQNTGLTGFSWFNIGSDDSNPLPVELSNLSATCNEQSDVYVYWKTSSEQHSEKFIVEKSRDLQHWMYVGEVPAAGNSNYSIDYQADDHNAFSGISYYRLIQLDIDGAQKIYGPVSVSCEAVESNVITVFPNPTDQNFTVQISSDGSKFNASVRLCDPAGKIIATRNINLVEGINQVLFDTEQLAKGAYIIYVEAEKAFQPVKLIVN